MAKKTRKQIIECAIDVIKSKGKMSDGSFGPLKPDAPLYRAGDRPLDDYSCFCTAGAIQFCAEGNPNGTKYLKTARLLDKFGQFIGGNDRYSVYKWNDEMARKDPVKAAKVVAATLTEFLTTL